MKIALLSNVTTDILAGMLRDEHPVWTPSGFGAWVETALAPPRDLVAFAPDVIAVLLDRRFAPCVEAELLPQVRDTLSHAFPDAALVVPDVEAVLADLGDAAWDERMWKLAKMPWSIDALSELRKLLVPQKKVLALDLDNTLWDGIVSEDGPSGVKPNLALQREALELRSRGVVLVALSKNDPEDVAPMWDDPRMLLRAGDFASMRINWDAKSGNLADVAKELGLGADSFVFVDDSPSNRAEMRASLPEVAVSHFPPDLGVYFPLQRVTDEDRSRSEMYKAEARRREARVGMTYDDYLRSLGIVNEVRPVSAADVPRVAQLSQRSNQMNVLTIRRTEREILGFASDPSSVMLALRSSDRFGDLGLVAFVHARTDGGSAEIVDWVMSCRAMNRRIEFALEAELERVLAERGVREISARWMRTAKNGPSRDLFDRLGFDLRGESDGERRYLRRVSAAPRTHSGDYLNDSDLL